MDKHFIRVSSTDSRYLEYDDGRPFVPNGANLCFPRRLREEEAVFGYYEELFSSLGRNGGNFARIWLSSPFLRWSRSGRENLIPRGGGGSRRWRNWRRSMESSSSLR